MENKQLKRAVLLTIEEWEDVKLHLLELKCDCARGMVREIDEQIDREPKGVPLKYVVMDDEGEAVIKKACRIAIYETQIKLAKKYNMNVDALAKLNNSTEANESLKVEMLEDDERMFLLTKII